MVGNLPNDEARHVGQCVSIDGRMLYVFDHKHSGEEDIRESSDDHVWEDGVFSFYKERESDGSTFVLNLLLW